MTRSLGMLFSVSTSMADISALFVYHIDIRISIRNNYKGLLCTSWESSPGHWGCCSRRPPAWPTYLRRFCIILIEEFQSETTIKLCKGPLVSSAHAQNWRMRSAMVCVISLSNPFIRHSVIAVNDISEHGAVGSQNYSVGSEDSLIIRDQGNVSISFLSV